MNGDADTSLPLCALSVSPLVGIALAVLLSAVTRQPRAPKLALLAAGATVGDLRRRLTTAGHPPIST